MAEFPEAFIQRLQQQRTDAEQLLNALNEEAPVSIRLNPHKKTIQFEQEATVPWCALGRYLTKRPSFTKDPLFHAGAYYPQEAGSMFIDAILKQLTLPDDCVALDLCAAPGGKSTILLDNLSDTSLLISNEIARNRAYILRDNLSRWGKANILVTNRSAADFGAFSGLCDLILIDAPCSGEGMFRKDLNARMEWSMKNADHCALRQTEILDDAWPALKQGGYLIYSTCTFNPDENHKQIERLLMEKDCELVHLDFPVNYNLEVQEKRNAALEIFGYSCFPHKMKTEGFFFSVLRKTESTRNFQLKNKKEAKKRREAVQELPDFQVPKNHQVVCLNESFYLVPQNQATLMMHLQQQLSCMKFGVRLGEVLGNKWIPHYEYALSIFDEFQFTSSELNLENALSYLKGHPVPLEGKDGWHLAHYQGHSLGWLKKIGNRSNNYYPKELRIKMDIG